MCWLGIRQLTVVGIAEYADIPEQLYWKGIIYPSGIRQRETLGVRKLAHAGNWSLKTASFGHFYCKPVPSHPHTHVPSPGGMKVIDCNETLLSKQQASFSGHQLYQLTTGPAVIPPDPCEWSRMLPAKLLRGKAGRSAGSAVPGVQPLWSPLCQQLALRQQCFEDAGKEAAILREKRSVGSPNLFWPSQILLRFPREQFISWPNSSLCNCIYWVMILS